MEYSSLVVVVVHYNEIALKLGHRPMFQSNLVENLRRSIEEFGTGKVRVVHGRLLVDPGSADVDEVVQRLIVVPGSTHGSAAPGLIEALGG